MTRPASSTILFVLSGLLGACGGGTSEKPAAPASAPSSAWIASVKPWYCGTEALPPKVGKDGVSTPQVRDVAIKVVPGSGSFTAIYGATAGGNDKSIGSWTRFVAGAERAATLRWENDQKQKGDVELTFSPDYSTVTVKWTAAVTPPGSSAVPPAPTTLTAAAGPAGCSAGTLIR